MSEIELFDAVRIVKLPEGKQEMPVRYSHTGVRAIRIGDIGVVIGDWMGGRWRVERVDAAGATVWQDDFFEPEHLERLPPTAAPYSRRRIHEHWSYQMPLGKELLDAATRQTALSFARKVMAFARQNVDLLISRLRASGYQFAHERQLDEWMIQEGFTRGHVWQPPEPGVSDAVRALAELGVHIPVVLEAWLVEVGRVDLSGTHPDWPRSGHFGMGPEDPDNDPDKLWYTDPLVLDFSPVELLESFQKRPRQGRPKWLVLAGDVVTKANVSGSSVSVGAAKPSFDPPLSGQIGGFTLFAYLRHAFAWSGFPGFDYIVDPPRAWLDDIGRGLMRL